MTPLHQTLFYKINKPVTAMRNGSSPTSIKIISFPSLEEVVLTGWEDPRKMSLKEETPEEVETSKEKIIEEEKEKKKNKFNIGGSIPLSPLGPEPREWGKEQLSPDAIRG